MKEAAETALWKELYQSATEPTIEKEPELTDEEHDSLVRELDELRKLMPREKISLEEAMREAEAYYKELQMYDWGARTMSNEHDMTRKYGSQIINEIRRCQWDCERIPKSLIAQMHRIHEGKSRKPKKNVPASQGVKKPQEQKTSQPKKEETGKTPSLKPKAYENTRFSMVRAGIFNVAKEKKELQNPTTLLLYFLQHRPWKGKRDKHDTYRTWYVRRGLIVASVSVEQMCKDLGVHEKTIRNWIKTLHESGLIDKIKVGQENIYVLGQVIEGEERFYYSGEISPKPKPEQIH